MICLRRDMSRSATPLLLISLEISDTLFLSAVFCASDDEPFSQTTSPRRPRVLRRQRAHQDRLHHEVVDAARRRVEIARQLTQPGHRPTVAGRVRSQVARRYQVLVAAAVGRRAVPHFHLLVVERVRHSNERRSIAMIVSRRDGSDDSLMT